MRQNIIFFSFLFYCHAGIAGTLDQLKSPFLDCHAIQVFNILKQGKLKYFPSYNDTLSAKSISEGYIEFSLAGKIHRVPFSKLKLLITNNREELSFPVDNYKLRVDIQNKSSERVGYIWKLFKNKEIKVAKLQCS